MSKPSEQLRAPSWAKTSQETAPVGRGAFPIAGHKEEGGVDDQL